jgi:hypothetical protein
MIDFLLFVGLALPTLIIIWGLAAIVVINIYEWLRDRK